MRRVALMMPLLLLACSRDAGRLRTVELPGASPLVTFRVVFLTGSASDPAGKAGLANLTALMLSQGGSKDMTYDQIVTAMFPMATSVASQVDKEMTTFSAVTHVDNLDKFYAMFRAMLLEPGWRDADLRRLRDQTINFLRVGLRGANEEELGKEVLYSAIYDGHPYMRPNAGTVSALSSITLDDLKQFYRDEYTRSNVVLGLAGGYPKEFLERVKRDFASLPEGAPRAAARPEPKPIDGIRVRMIEKQTRSVAFSFGFPISVTRNHPDFLPLLVMQSYFGQHRSSGGRLFQRLREERGLNYGDYAYIEYFPRGMFQLEPDPNLARPQQIFQIWIRPVEPPTAQFALRLAFFELNRLLEEGVPKEDFERTKAYLTKYVNLLIRNKDAELGYRIDSLYYGIPEYGRYVREGLAKVTLEDVNRAIRQHLRADNLHLVVVAEDCEALRARLISGKPSPMTYNSPKPAEILAEDKTVENWEIPFRPDAFEIVPVDKVFE